MGPKKVLPPFLIKDVSGTWNLSLNAFSTTSFTSSGGISVSDM